MFETRGRKNIVTYVDGEYVMVKKPLKIGKAAVAVTIPKEWIDSVSGDRVLRYILMDVRENQIILKPYFENIEGVD